MTPVELVLLKLPDAKKNGRGWSARCPAHEDRRPSLTIAEGDDGRVLLRCHAGCEFRDIVAALGLEPKDAMPEKTPSQPRPRKAPAPAVFPTADAAANDLQRTRGKADAMWTYHDAAGEPAGLVLRWDRPAGGKDIRPVSLTPGGWGQTGMSEPRPLYRLPELLARSSERVYVTEGEKAADAAVSIGLLATTSSHGAKSPDKTDWTPLAGRDVVILPDNDKAGRKYADAVADILLKLKPPAAVRVVNIPGLPESGDIWDWVEDRDSVESEALVAQVEALVNAADAVKPEDKAPDLPQWQPFPVHVLPELVRAFVVNSSKAIGCDSSFIALPLLAGLASAIGNTRRIQLKRGWTEPAILWAVIVGDSGTLKSPALELALRPIRRRQRKAMKRYAEEMRGYKTALAAFKKTKGDDESAVEPVQPMADRCWCDDVTVEALAVLLQNQWRGLLVIRDELSGWLAGFDRYAQGKGGDVSKWLEMHGGRSMVVDRKTGIPPMIHVDRAAVSIAGGIQPETLRRALGEEHRENGLAARLLLACPPRKPKRWTDVDIPQEHEDALERVFGGLFNLEPFIDCEGERKPVIVKLDPEAKALWVDFYNAHAVEHANLTGELSAVWSKLEGYAARLALVIHYARWAAGESWLDLERVDAVSIAAGVELSGWLGNEAKRVYAILGESDEDRDRRRLVELIGRKGGAVTARDLQQASKLHKTADDAEAALTELVTAGFGQWEDRPPTARGGRPTCVFRLSAASTLQNP